MQCQLYLKNKIKRERSIKTAKGTYTCLQLGLILRETISAGEWLSPRVSGACMGTSRTLGLRHCKRRCHGGLCREKNSGFFRRLSPIQFYAEAERSEGMGVFALPFGSVSETKLSGSSGQDPGPASPGLLGGRMSNQLPGTKSLAGKSQINNESRAWQGRSVG